MTAVVFDMDGVLFDTERLCLRSWCEVAERRKYPDMEKVFYQCIGRSSTDSYHILMDYYGETFPYDDFRKDADTLFWQSIEEKGAPMLPYVLELLDYLKEQKIPVALASSSSRPTVERLLNRANIGNYFDLLVTGDMVKHSKPDPTIYLMACEMLGVSPKDAYAVEDSYNGIRSANSAGMKPLMVPDMIQPDAEMENLSHAILENLREVKEFLIQELQ